MTSKEELHRLLDELPEGELHAVRRFLEFLRSGRHDPLIRALVEATEDDEAETPEEAVAIREAWQDCLSGKTRPWPEVRKELGGE